jgi:hypothetical protein
MSHLQVRRRHRYHRAVAVGQVVGLDYRAGADLCLRRRGVFRYQARAGHWAQVA